MAVLNNWLELERFIRRDANVYNNLELVKTLIRHGANVNAPSGPGFHKWTALHAACFRGNVNVVRCLVEHGADLHRPDTEGLDAMKIAAVHGQPEMLEYLIQVRLITASAYLPAIGIHLR